MGYGSERLLLIFFMFVLIAHIITCLWIFSASFATDYEGTWMEGDFAALGSSDQYLTSFYFTITTITTVGYGDISGGTNVEKIFCICMMLSGVISFSVLSGSLANILQNYDVSNAEF
jgi:hypothetical protein|tara:strand:+ start:959 stop:1309 length:351 start_codon:yes stop_codon:yes gene_type:complete